eukprot:6989969-Prymnesium_polylepis.2
MTGPSRSCLGTFIDTGTRQVEGRVVYQHESNGQFFYFWDGGSWAGWQCSNDHTQGNSLVFGSSRCTPPVAAVCAIWWQYWTPTQQMWKDAVDYTVSDRQSLRPPTLPSPPDSPSPPLHPPSPPIMHFSSWDEFYPSHCTQTGRICDCYLAPGNRLTLTSHIHLSAAVFNEYLIHSEGEGATIDAQLNSPIFDVNAPITLHLHSLTLVNGWADREQGVEADGKGGAINCRGRVNMANSRIANSSAYSGGGAMEAR